jgi:hypothetical protein
MRHCRFCRLAGLHSFRVLACLDHHLNDLDDLLGHFATGWTRWRQVALADPRPVRQFLAGPQEFRGDLKRVKAECDKRQIRIRYWEEDERIRVSTHIFTQQTELNAFFDALERGLGG